MLQTFLSDLPRDDIYISDGEDDDDASLDSDPRSRGAGRSQRTSESKGPKVVRSVYVCLGRGVIAPSAQVLSGSSSKPSRALTHPLTLGATVYDLLKWKMIKRRKKRIHCWCH